MKNIFFRKQKTNQAETELIDRLLQNDQQAFKFVVDKYHQVMILVAAAIVGDSVAEEVVQEAWVKAIKALPNFRRDSSLRTWLLAIVSNMAKTRYRKEKRFVYWADIDPEKGWTHGDSQLEIQFNARQDSAYCQWNLSTPEQLLNSLELRNIISHAIMLLTPLQHAVLTMKEFETMGKDEICGLLNIKPNNFRVILHRARTHIYDAIDNYEKCLSQAQSICDSTPKCVNWIPVDLST